MFGNTFYHALTRKYVTLFGTLFNNFIIQRTSGIPQIIDNIKVPITYSSQDKMLSRVFGDEELDRKPAVRTPAMSFEMLAPYYDAERKLASQNRICIVDDEGMKFQYIGVPYIIPFRLYIYSRDEEDGLKVLEQIYPYFTPSLNVTAKLIDETDFAMDIPITLKSVDVDNNSYGEYQNRRSIVWTLNFEMKALFLGPVVGGRKVIRVAHVNIRDLNSREIIEEVHTQPGLTVDGKPTSNSELSVPPSEIEEDDDYGFIVEINEGPDPHP